MAVVTSKYQVFVFLLLKGFSFSMTRRGVRTYDPPDVRGYFDQSIWPEYEKHRDEGFKQVPYVTVIDGNQNRTSVLKRVLLGITQRAHELLHLENS
ncbi:hypothetical protein B7P43_G14790 [Cryptotermes secundus]|uniref:Nicotinamide riboside kinase 1 n=1 Tax=Cryptotermes secundus TaxID=105785 RepID=A0A2J7PPQ9_9NEOP|nr:hypothetical protein B7P43_G14790 [Cryptotermes secundus]